MQNSFVVSLDGVDDYPTTIAVYLILFNNYSIGQFLTISKMGDSDATSM